MSVEGTRMSVGKFHTRRQRIATAYKSKAHAERCKKILEYFKEGTLGLANKVNIHVFRKVKV